MLKKLLIAFGVLLVAGAAFAGYVAMQPNEFRVVRTATMAAPTSVVFDQVNDFQKWNAWSPWAKLDPSAKNSFDGPASGEGAKFAWDGNDEVGAGSMTILESRPSELVKIDLRFTRPMEDSCLTEFAFKPEGDKTAVTWTMSGQNNFIGKAMCMFMDMDEMVGGQFDEGLNNIKAIVEAEPTAAEPAQSESADPATTAVEPSAAEPATAAPTEESAGQ